MRRHELCIKTFSFHMSCHYFHRQSVHHMCFDDMTSIFVPKIPSDTKLSSSSHEIKLTLLSKASKSTASLPLC